MTEPADRPPQVRTHRKLGEYAIAATAFLVSLCSLFIYIYQSKIMSEQQQVSVWPYLQWSSSNVNAFEFNVTNKGVGPAIVRKVEMMYNGKPVANNRALVDAVTGKDSTTKWQNSTLEENVLAPGENLTILSIADRAEGRAFEARLREGKFTMKITYCSVYGRCWNTGGFDAKRAPDDKTIEY